MNYKSTKNKYTLGVFILFFLSCNSPMLAQFYTAEKKMKKFNVSPKKKEVEKQDFSLDSLFISEVDTIYERVLHPPLDNMEVTSDFGYRFHPVDNVYKNHNGIDLKGNSVFTYSISKGIVSSVGYGEGLGIYCRVKIGTFEFTYGHLDEIYVYEGKIVGPGTILGLTGSTGKVTGPHLHLSVKSNGRYIDPIDFLIYIESAEDLAYDRSVITE